MKKKLLSILLTLAMIMSLMPTALAATTYDLWVGGVRVTSDNASNITGDGIQVGEGGKVSYDAETNTLTLDNATITGYYQNTGIRTRGIDLTVELVGDNSVIGQYNNGNANYGMYIDGGDLSFTGDGKLTVTAADVGETNWAAAILADGNISVDGCTLIAHLGENGSAAIYPGYDEGSLILNGSVVTVASMNSDGNPAVDYNEGNVKKYKYLKIEPASEFAAKIGEQYYATLADAVKAAKAGDTITLLNDVTVNSAVEINKSITLDGDGHTINNTASYSNNATTLSMSAQANITLKNLKITAAGNVVRWGYVNKGYTHTYENCQISGGVYGIHYDGNEGEVVFDGCTIDGFNAFAGTLKQVTIKDTTFDANKSSYAGANLWGYTVIENVTLVDEGKNTWLDVKTTAQVTGGKVMKDGTEVSLESYLDVEAKIGTTYYNTLQDALDAAKNGDVITLTDDITGDVTVTQKPDVKITIDGAGKTFAGTIIVDGKSGTYLTAGLTIKNVNFDASSISKAACINLGDGTDPTRYICNLTVQDCTFTGVDKAKVAIKSYTAGDKNLSIINCTVDNTMHSLLQIAGVDGAVVDGCKVSSKNGINLNQSTNVEIKNCEFDVNGYAVRMGVAGSAACGKVTLINNTMETESTEDATIVIRSATDLTIESGMMPSLELEGNITANISVVGGTFAFNPTAYVAEDYIAKKDGDNFTVVEKADLTEGTYMADPTGATARHYYVTENEDGSWTVYYRAPSSGGSSSGGSSSGGSSSGGSSAPTTSTTTQTNSDGSSVTTTVNNVTGVTTEVSKAADGTTATIVTDKNGEVTEVSATVPSAAAQGDEPVTLPVEVTVTDNSKESVVIDVNVPAGGAQIEIPVENVTPGTVVVIVNADGTESIVPTTTLTEDGVVVTLDADATIKVIDNSKDFTDVADDYALADSIDFVSARGLFEGNTATTFNPHADTTIAQTMTVLARLSGEDFYGAGSTTKGAEWAIEKGLHDGTPVHQAITREQMVVMMWKLAGSPESDHPLTASDVNAISADAMAAMQWAVEMGILKGNTDGTLNPQGNASRAHVAAFAERYVNAIA